MAKKIKYGKVGLKELGFNSKEELMDPKTCKIRITTFIDGDIYDALKADALASGGKYQTKINKILRDYVESKKENK